MRYTESKYLIRGYCSDTDGGYDDETEADTLKDAKTKAKHMMSDTYTRLVESTVPVAYVQVVNAKTGEIILDFGQPSQEPTKTIEEPCKHSHGDLNRCHGCGKPWEMIRADRIRAENLARVSSPAYRKAQSAVTRAEKSIRKNVK